MDRRACVLTARKRAARLEDERARAAGALTNGENCGRARATGAPHTESGGVGLALVDDAGPRTRARF